MPLSVYQWQEPDPTGVVDAWLQGLASSQHAEALLQAQAAHAQNAYHLAAELRLKRAQEERLAQQAADDRAPYIDPYATGVGATVPEAGVVPGSPIHAPAVAVPMATAATPQDGASIVLGTPSPGASLIQGANAGDNAALSTMDALGGGAAPGLTLAQRNPNAAAVSLGAPVQFPTPVAAGAQVAAAPPVNEMDRQSKILDDRLKQALARGENPDEVSLRTSDMVPPAPVGAAVTGPATPADMVLAGGSDFSKPIDMLTAANPVGGMVPQPVTPGATGLPIDWIKQQEGFSPRAFKDGKQFTVGWGSKAQSPNETITPEQATDRLTKELSDSARSVDNAADKAGMTLTPAQREALISYDFNTGKGAAAITQSGGDPRAVASAILHGPVTQDGRVLPGLVTRRRAEYARFMSDVAAMPDDATVAPPAPGTGAAAALATTASDPASQVLAAGQAELRRLSADLAARRVPAKVAQAALNQEQQKISAAVLAASKPGAARNIDPLSPEGLKARSALEVAKNSPEAVAAAVAKAKAVAEVRAADRNIDPNSQAGIDAAVEKAKQIAALHDATVSDLTKDMTFVPEHNTYKKADGSEWFVNGKSLTSYRPLQVKAERWAQGDDGNVYPLGNNGEPLKPVPDGVNLNLTGGKIQTRTINGTLYQVNADGTSKPIITSQAMPKGSDRADFESDLKQLHTVADDYNTKKRAVEQNGSKTLWGTSSADVDAAKKKLDAVKEKMDRWQRTYPGVKAALEASAPPPPPPAPSADPSSDPGAFTAAFAAAKSGDVLTFQGKQYRKP